MAVKELGTCDLYPQVSFSFFGCIICSDVLCDDLDFYTSELPDFGRSTAAPLIRSSLTLIKFISDLRHDSLLLVIWMFDHMLCFLCMVHVLISKLSNPEVLVTGREMNYKL